MVAAGSTADVWLDVAIVVTVVGVAPMGKVGLMGKGCAITLMLNLLLMGALGLFFSAFLGTGVFHGKELFSGK